MVRRNCNNIVIKKQHCRILILEHAPALGYRAIAKKATYQPHGAIDARLMVMFGVLGYGFMMLDSEPVPFILGFLLGPMLEVNFRQAMLLSRGSFDIFVTRPIRMRRPSSKRNRPRRRWSSCSAQRALRMIWISSSLIFLRSVLRLTPRSSAALIWFPRVDARAALISGFSTSRKIR